MKIRQKNIFESWWRGGKTKMKNKLLSMSQASRVCPYEKGYLSLLARRGEIKAEKVGRNWYTTVEWLNEYLLKKKPGDMISQEPKNEIRPAEIKKLSLETWRMKWFAGIAALTLVFAGFFIFQYILSKVNNLEEKSKNNQFVTDEIVKIPDEEGNYDVYGKGSVKIGKEIKPNSSRAPY